MKKILFLSIAIFTLLACNTKKSTAQTVSPSESVAQIIGTISSPTNPQTITHGVIDTAWLKYTIPSAGAVTIAFNMVSATAGNISGTITRYVSVDGTVWVPWTTQNASDSASNVWTPAALVATPPASINGATIYTYAKTWTYPYYNTTTTWYGSTTSFPWKYMLIRYISAVQASSPATVTLSGRVLTRRVSQY